MKFCIKIFYSFCKLVIISTNNYYMWIYCIFYGISFSEKFWSCD